MKLTKEAVATIKSLEDRRGRLTPEQIVNEARAKDSPIHHFFTWDDSEAAEKWRIEEARELLKRIKIVVQIEERIIRTVAYVHDPQQDTNRAGYVTVLKVRTQDAAGMMKAELEAISFLLERSYGLSQVKAIELPGLAGKIMLIKDQIDQLVKEL